MSRRVIATVALTLLVCLPAAAQTDNGTPPSPPSPTPPLPVDGTWTLFCWAGTGSLNNEGAFTFTGSATLEVTDAFIDGDQFEVLDGGVSIGSTSVPTDTGSFEGDPDLAFADPDFSSGAFALGGGSHSITLRTIATATGFPDGCGFLRAVPLSAPAMPRGAAAVLMLALAAAGYLVLRRRTAA